MIEFKIHDGLRAEMAKYHREFQCAVAHFANEELGNLSPKDRRNDFAIGKHEGGVVVWVNDGDEIQRKEICIKRDFVFDDWDKYNNAPKPWEQAVVNAIGHIACCVDEFGVEWLTKFSEQAKGAFFDPLRSFFNG